MLRHRLKIVLLVAAIAGCGGGSEALKTPDDQLRPSALQTSEASTQGSVVPELQTADVNQGNQPPSSMQVGEPENTITAQAPVSPSTPTAPPATWPSNPAASALEQCPISKPSLVASLAEVLGEIRTMDVNSWRKINLNTFASVAQPLALKPNCTSVVGHSAIINAWGAFAYDSRRGDMITFGGGHADYCGNDVYRFRLSTRRWERAGISSQMTSYQRATNEQWALPSEGLAHAPATAHMYDGLMYVPLADRMVYFGYGTPSYAGVGAPPLTAALQPKTGPWFFDPNKANPGKVVGSDASAVDPAIPGGYMWENREYASNHPGAFLPPGFGPQTASSGTACENGKDVIYMRTSGSAGVSSGLVKYVINDISDARMDVMSAVGAQSNHMSQADMAVDTEHSIAVVVGDGARRFAFWDLSSSAPQNELKSVTNVNDLTGGFVVDANTGMDYDPIRKRLLLWRGTSDVWDLHVPDGKPTSTNGWSVERIFSTGGPVEVLLPASGGAVGKWKYAPGLDVFLALREAPDGEVWIYKPAGWVDPAE